MTRVMFDTNAYDKILEGGDGRRVRALIDDGKIIVITTHIQEDQIRKNPKAEERKELLDLFFQLNSKRENTSLALWGISKWDESPFSGESENAKLTAIQRNLVTPSEDEILGTTAEKLCDVFVTDDKKFSARLIKAAPNLRVLTYENFRKEFLA
ncbi:MAG: hypothetical protein VW600_14425 [Ferrovibrio sp.]